MKEIISKYMASEDDDEKMDILLDITENIDLDTYEFLLKELNSKHIDEFVAVEIIKVVSLYSPSSQQDQTIQVLFSIIENNYDELVRTYALQGLEHLPLVEKHYQLIQNIAQSEVDEDLKATAEVILVRSNK